MRTEDDFLFWVGFFFFFLKLVGTERKREHIHVMARKSYERVKKETKKGER